MNNTLVIDPRTGSFVMINRIIKIENCKYNDKYPDSNSLIILEGGEYAYSRYTPNVLRSKLESL